MKRKLRKILAIFLVLTLLSADICAIAEAVATLSLPSALQIIDESAFYGDTSIDKVVVPDGTVEIRRKAFANSSLKELVLPDTIEYIASDAFDGCEDISVTVPEGCYAYNRCVALGLIKPMLDAPGNVEATVVSESALNISWTAVEGADGYYIISDGEVVGDVYGENTCSFMWQGLEPNTVYEASVKAYYFKNNGEESIGYESASVSCKTAETLSVSATVADRELMLSESISVSAVVSGNYGDCTYRYTVKKGTEVVAASRASTEAQYSYAPVTVGDYSVIVVATDSLGRSVSSQIDGITVNVTALELGEMTIDKSVIMLGETVTIMADSNRPSENLTYSANVYCDDIKVDQILGVGKLTYTPDAVGTYSFAIEITDSYGETGYAHLSNAVTVRPYWVLTGVTTNVSSASVGDAITITAVTEGDTTNAKLTYTIHKDSAVYRQIENVTQKQYTFYANDEGAYKCVCTATDAYGNEMSVTSSNIAVTRKNVVNTILEVNHSNTLNVDELNGKTVRIEKKDTIITWDKLSGDSYYVLEIGCSKLGTDIVYSENYKTNTFTILASQLQPGYEYDVDVERYNSSGKCTGYVDCEFVVTGGASLNLESSPQLIVPSQDATVNYDDLTIQWTQMHYAESIEIELIYDCGPTEHSILHETVEGNVCTYTIPKDLLVKNGEFYIDIKAKDALGYQKRGTTCYFYVECDENTANKIEEPVFTSPFLYKMFITSYVLTYPKYEDIVITWEDVPAAEYFSLHLSDSENDLEYSYDRIQSNSFTIPVSILRSGSRYDIEVWAHHSEECYEKSNNMSFRAPYKGDLLLNPPVSTNIDLSKNADDPTTMIRQDLNIEWKPVSAAISYDVILREEEDHDLIDFEMKGLVDPIVTIPRTNMASNCLYSLIIYAYDSAGNESHTEYYILPMKSTISSPTLLYPDFSTDSENIPAYSANDLTLIWNIVEDAIEYRVQVCDYYGEDWDDVIDSQITEDETFTIPADELYMGGRFVVKIKAIDQYGNGRSSQNYYFQVGSSDYMHLSRTEWTYGYEGGSKNCTLRTSQEWMATTSDSWISVSKTSGDASMNVVITTAENPGDFPRSGSVTFTNSAGGCAVFSVTQDGNGSSNTGALKITSPEQGETIDYAKFRTYWDYNCDHAYYTVALYDVTSGKTVYTNDMETLEYDDIPQSALTYGHIYQLTVAVYNAQYSKISQSSIVFRVESLSSDGSQTNPDDGDDGVIEDTEIPEGANDLVCVGIENGAEIQKKDLSISWQNVIGADRYWVALRDMTLYPDDKYTSEEAKKVIDQETLLNVNILEGQLTEGHAYRLWIGAYGMDDEDPLCQKSISFTVAKAAEEGDEPENTDTGIPTATLKLASDEVVLGDSIALQGVVRANGGALDQVRVTIQDAQTGAFCDYAIYNQSGISSFGNSDSFDLSNIPAIPTNMTIHESGSSEARPASTSIDLSTAGNRYNIIVYARNIDSETMTSLASATVMLTDVHSHVPKTTTYFGHAYESIDGDNVNHRAVAVIWDCTCSSCGEQYYYRDETGTSEHPLPFVEKHSPDVDGYCHKCNHFCEHDYGFIDEWKDNSGIWQDCGNGYHIRLNVIQYKECAYCGNKIGERVVEENFPQQVHTKRIRKWYINYEQLDAADVKYYTHHRATYESWNYCSATGCLYEKKLGTYTAEEAHVFKDGVCACGVDDGGVTMVKLTSKHILKWSLDKVNYYVDKKNGIEIVNDGTAKSMGIWVDENGKGVTGSSNDGAYYFDIEPVGSGVLKDGKVYANSTIMNKDDTQWIAKRYDNFTIGVQCDGQFRIKVYSQNNGTKKLLHTVEVKIDKINDAYLYGWDVGYIESEFGYSKSVQLTDTIRNTLSTNANDFNHDRARLWFDLNTAAGGLRLKDQIPVFEFEFIDEEKKTLSGFMQMVVLSGVRNAIVDVTDLSVSGILTKAFPSTAKLADYLENGDEERQMARIIVNYLGSIDIDGLDLIDMAYDDFGTFQDIVTVNDVLKLDKLLLLCRPEVRELLNGKLEHFKTLVGYIKNHNIPVTTNLKEITTLGVVTFAIDIIFQEMRLAIDSCNADIVRQKIERGIISLNGLSDEMQTLVLDILDDQIDSEDEELWIMLDSISSSAASEALSLCPPAAAIYATLNIGSSLMGYEEFENSLSDLLLANDMYDNCKEELLTAMDKFAKSPTTANYSAVMDATEAYNTYASICISQYASWRKTEASSALKQIFTNEEPYIKEAEANRVKSKNLLDAYYKRIKNGAMR